MSRAIERLRARAVAQTLFAPTTLPGAMRRLGFVQADPIRAPARAQDLILRHRVKEYAAGDLERRYARLGLEEDYLYAYGFATRDVQRLLHPRPPSRPLNALERDVLAYIRDHRELHPADLEERFGKERRINAWGGNSKATTHALDWLHYSGYLRVVRRENGIRVYAPVPPLEAAMTPLERFERLVLVVANILAPAPEPTLSGLAAQIRRRVHADLDHRATLRALIAAGKLESETVDGVRFLRVPGAKRGPNDEAVRLLAPFDPIVWDRRRFEHLWGWEYRFEAYTPPAKRVRGYYALPLLWRNAVIGWANVSSTAKGLHVETGFVGKRPRERAFPDALAQEIEHMRVFLGRSADESAST